MEIPLAVINKTRHAVWDSNFMMVQHMSVASGTQPDSTSNGYNAVPSGVTQGVAGKIGGADKFSGSTSSYLAVGAIIATDWTVSFWASSGSTSAAAIYPIGLGGNKGIGMGGTASDINDEFYVYDGSSVVYGGPKSHNKHLVLRLA